MRLCESGVFDDIRGGLARKAATNVGPVTESLPVLP